MFTNENKRNIFEMHAGQYVQYFKQYELKSLSSLNKYGQNRKVRLIAKNDWFVLYDYSIKQYSSFCKYLNISLRVVSALNPTGSGRYHLSGPIQCPR